MTRVGANDFFATALIMLEEGGFPSVTAAGLCQRMAVTRGSFYHHFTAFDVFVRALMDYWRLTYTDDLLAEAEGSADSLELQLDMQVRLAASLPHGAEVGLRAWGTVDPDVRRALKEVDRLRVSGLASSLKRRGIEAQLANAYARLTIAALVGAQMTGGPLGEADLADVLWTIRRDVLREASQSRA